MALRGAKVKPAGYRHWLKLPPEIRKGIPVEDAWAIHPDTRYEFWRRKAQERKALAERLSDPKNPRLSKERRAFKIACVADPVFFIENVIWTADPEAPLQRPREIPYYPFGYAKELWIKPWTLDIRKARSRRVHEKTRRQLASITLMAWKYWAWNFIPGYKGWVGTHSIEMVDKGEDWDSLLGKFRFYHRKAREFFPWLFPPLIRQSDHDMLTYIRYPPWKEGSVEINRECWGNEMRGVLPSEVARRGGGCTDGSLDEAGWCKDLLAFIGSIDSMTPHYKELSTPSPDMQHPFAVHAKRSPGYKCNAAPWYLNPMKVGPTEDDPRYIHWDEDAEFRGSYTKKWRSPYYYTRLEENEGQLHLVAQNEDLDYRATGGSRVLLGFNREVQCGSTDPKSDTYDLYDPTWPTYVWYDVGRGDPWAFIWVQASDATGEVRIVDYTMRKDVIVDYFVPMMGGWNFDNKERETGAGEYRGWLTSPDRLPWKTAVPWGYSLEDEQIIRRWHGRRRPKWLVGDIQGKGRTPTGTQYTLEDILRFYGFTVFSSSPAHHLDDWIDHANAVLPRVKISGFLVGKRPQGLWPAIDEMFEFWQRSESTEMGRVARPLHDDYSHPGTAFVFGCWYLPRKIQADMGGPNRTRRVLESTGQGRMTRASGRNPYTGWL